jgi:hypothetical protein
MIVTYESDSEDHVELDKDTKNWTITEKDGVTTFSFSVQKEDTDYGPTN